MSRRSPVLLLCLCAVAVCGCFAASGANTQLRSPTTTPSSFHWENVPYAFANGGGEAHPTWGGAEATFSGFGFSIPTGRPILGIEVLVDARLEGTPMNAFRVFLVAAGGYTPAGSPGVQQTSTETTYSVGGATETWGRAWTAEELNSGDFAIMVKADIDSRWELYVDWVRVNVYYGDPVSPISVLPSGAAGSGSFLDRSLDLEEDEEPPLVGGERIQAVYDAGEEIGGGCVLVNAAGNPILNSYVIVELYLLNLLAEPITHERIERFFVRYSRDTGEYSFEIATDELEPGYYDLRLALPDGTSSKTRIQVIEADI